MIPDASQLSLNLKGIYAPLKAQLSPLDYCKTVLRPYYAPIGAILPFIEPGTTLAEIGCGMGPVIFSIAGFRPVAGYLGIDTDSRALDIARRANRYRNFSFTPGTLFDIPRSRLSEYGTIICFDVLHHIPRHEKRSFLHYLIDAASHNAVIIIKDFDARPRLRTLANDVTDWLSTRSTASYMRSEDLTNLLVNKGCDILHIGKRTMWIWSHLLVVARKTHG